MACMLIFGGIPLYNKGGNYVEKSPELHKKIEAERVGESRLQSSSIKNIPSSNDNVNSKFSIEVDSEDNKLSKDQQ